MNSTRPLERYLFVLLISLSALFGAASSALANDWNGDWNSDFGQLRLLQNGDRLYGDYANNGVIEGRISPDGITARAIFFHLEGRWKGQWGTVEWRKANDRIGGTWAWSGAGITKPKNGNSWTATRTSARTSPLRFADQFVEKYPTNDPNFGEGPFPDWISAVAGTARPTPPQNVRDGLSDWYGGYTLTNMDGAFNIEADVIHYRGADTAAVDISIFVNPGQPCPRVMHTGFCAELATKADSRGNIEVTTTGVTFLNRGNISETIEVTFRLPGDRNDRALRISREATYLNAIMYHPRRGFDYSGYASYRQHICEQAQCMDEIFRDVRDNPARYRGNVDRGYITRMINLPNAIQQSHQGSQPQPSPQPNPQPSPDPRPLLSDAWVVLEETSDNLGEISFGPGPGGISASGVLRGFFNTGDDHQTDFALVSSTGEAVAFELITYAGQSGERKEGRLIVELPAFARDNPRGTLIVGDEILLVELARPTRGVDPRDVGDTPAIGIYSVNYRLRDVALDRSVRLMREPGSSTGFVGVISPNARQLQMLKCDANIDSQQFQSASFERKMALLSPHWCQVTNGQVAGWLPGRFLVPESN
ncbi:MAG: hypothetical protein AAGG69_03475 [Pseudomonadota bacterium]